MPSKLPIFKNELLVVYRGKMIYNYRGMGLCCVIGLLTFMSIVHFNNINLIVLLSVIAIAFFFIFSWYVYYIELSENYLIIRNNNMFWFKKIFKLSDVKQIAFELHTKMPPCIRIVTDESNSLYRCGTITDRQWIDLKQRLEDRNISIDDQFVDAIVFYEFTLFKEIKEIFSQFKQK